MSEKSIDIGDFFDANGAAEEEEVSTEVEELDVQKAVVEELAADKASLELRLTTVEAEKKALQAEEEQLKAQIAADQAKIADLERKIAAFELQENDIQARNPNQLALLDRDVDMPDRFPGETRDHVLEVIQEARDQAERDGRRRKAQLLESVLKANEPSGNLRKKRETFEKFMEQNHNILNGTVIAELEKYGIAYKEGGNNLLIGEIIKRTY